MSKTSVINVQGIDISIIQYKQEDYICLTDMVKAKNGGNRAADIIKNWIRNRCTIEFLGTWESFYNPNFKVVEFDHFKKEAGLHSFTMSVNNWIENTNAKRMERAKQRTCFIRRKHQRYGKYKRTEYSI